MVIEQLTEIASTDVLTGLRNRRFFEESLESSFSLSQSQGLPLSVVMIDVDYFKAYNDSFGHLAGDFVLRLVGERIRGSSRSYDVVARYGGEEFAILLPATDHAKAMSCAERQRAAMESYRWPQRPVTASFGVSTLRPGMQAASAVIEEADQALYHSKRSGRNRVSHFERIPSHFVSKNQGAGDPVR